MTDLRSYTCRRPTPEMRAAMANAEVGDDVYGDDPTVKALERATADLLGKEAAVYMPTGTMTNEVGIRAHTEPGDAVLFDENAHVYILEGGAPAALSGVLPRLLPGVRGIFTAQDVEAALGASHPFFPATIPAPVKLLCLENTHNIGGGSIWPLDQLQAVTDVGRARGLRLHLDGARLWHAMPPWPSPRQPTRRRSTASASASPRPWARRSAPAWPDRASSSPGPGGSSSRSAAASAKPGSLLPEPCTPCSTQAAPRRDPCPGATLHQGLAQIDGVAIIGDGRDHSAERTPAFQKCSLRGMQGSSAAHQRRRKAGWPTCFEGCEIIARQFLLTEQVTWTA